MTQSQQRTPCSYCSGLRDLALHLYELAAYCDYLDNRRIIFSRKKNVLVPEQEARTITAGSWLRLASQIEHVALDTYRFQEAHFYCEPVDELLRSDTKHYSSIATPLTRFIFFCNALEEIYRFVSPTYETFFDRISNKQIKQEYLRSPSMQAAILLDRTPNPMIAGDYQHLVDNLSQITHIYLTKFGGTFDLAGRTPKDLSYGFQLVRNVRNHVAHGVFQLLDNPDYSMGSDHLTRQNTINMLNQCVRVGAIGIQIILTIDNDGFKSQLYEDCQDDLDSGEYFLREIRHYLVNLHRRQSFGLNESSYYRWRDEIAG
ncbi:hypothetical protein [Chromobacterium haemolyticum]|uniref:hypothetical protein n=1 Tax=Chromobacterium haemolyticum TaxID=394935 RepID=UPI001269CBF2|nr:hypothetical protein [Chromobacterium haemolyticum]